MGPGNLADSLGNLAGAPNRREAPSGAIFLVPLDRPIGGKIGPLINSFFKMGGVCVRNAYTHPPGVCKTNPKVPNDMRFTAVKRKSAAAVRQLAIPQRRVPK